MSFLLDIQEPWVVIILAFISWVTTLVIWVFLPEYILIPLVISILLSIFAIVVFFIDTGSESAAKIDETTGKHRCRICHQYFHPEELLDNTCSTCRQIIE